VSKDSVAQKLGYNPMLEKPKLAAEQPPPPPQPPPSP